MSGAQQLEGMIAKFTGDAATPVDLDLLGEILERHQAAGIAPPAEALLEGELWNLRECCQCGESCWRDLPSSAMRHPGGVSLPWVGKSYTEHRICAITLNLRNLGELLDEVGIATDVAEAFERGRREVHNSTFRHRVLAAFAIVRASIEGRPLPPPPLSHLVGLTRPAEMAPWGHAEGERSEAEVP